MAKVTKPNLINSAAELQGIPASQAQAVIDAFLDAVTSALGGGDEVALHGFGTFKVSERAARMGRNPQTGAPVEIAATNAVTFKAATALKSAVN